MPLNIPVGTALGSVTMQVQGDSEPMLCTVGVRAVAGPIDVDHAQRLFACWTQNIMTNVQNIVTLTKATLRVRQDGGGDNVVEYVPAAPVVGTGAGSAVTPNVAILVEKITGRAGKRGRGRWYIPGANEALFDQAGVMVPANAATWNTALAEFLLDAAKPPEDLGITGKPIELLLFHGNTTTSEKTSPGPGITVVTTTVGAAGPLPDVITQLVVDQKAASQRRRLR